MNTVAKSGCSTLHYTIKGIAISRGGTLLLVTQHGEHIKYAEDRWSGGPITIQRDPDDTYISLEEGAE